jgi:hypothetical protein
MDSNWVITANLRYEVRPYQASTEYYGGGTVTKYRSVLQQAFQCVETGEFEWRDVPSVQGKEVKP